MAQLVAPVPQMAKRFAPLRLGHTLLQVLVQPIEVTQRPGVTEQPTGFGPLLSRQGHESRIDLVLRPMPIAQPSIPTKQSQRDPHLITGCLGQDRLIKGLFRPSPGGSSPSTGAARIPALTLHLVHLAVRLTSGF